MHDFAEGIVPWFLQRALLELNTNDELCALAAAKLDALRATVCSNLRWPRLSPDDLRGDRWNLNGMSKQKLPQYCMHACNCSVAM